MKMTDCVMGVSVLPLEKTDRLSTVPQSMGFFGEEDFFQAFLDPTIILPPKLPSHTPPSPQNQAIL